MCQSLEENINIKCYQVLLKEIYVCNVIVFISINIIENDRKSNIAESIVNLI